MDIISHVQQVICFAFHDSRLLMETCQEAKNLRKIVTLFYLDWHFYPCVYIILLHRSGLGESSAYFWFVIIVITINDIALTCFLYTPVKVF